MIAGVRQFGKGRFVPAEFPYIVSFKGKSASPLDFYYWCIHANLDVVLYDDALHFREDDNRTFFYMNFPVFK